MSAPQEPGKIAMGFGAVYLLVLIGGIVAIIVSGIKNSGHGAEVVDVIIGVAIFGPIIVLIVRAANRSQR